MLYPANEEKELPLSLFQNPTSEYRGTPFWAWNCDLPKELLLQEIDYMKEMGLGGFHIHSRNGMAVPYLSDAFMDLVKACNEKAKENEMLCWLYDEDRWPSGSAGGTLTKDHAYRMRYILFTPWSYDDPDAPSAAGEYSGARVGRSNNGTLLAQYAVKLENGRLVDYKMLDSSERSETRDHSNTGGKTGPDEQPPAGYTVWYAYKEVAPDTPWFNNQGYVNTLDKNAIEEFVRITHDRYYEVVGNDFGKSIPAIFTDEPQFSRKETLGFAGEKTDVIIPYTDDFDATFKMTTGIDFLPHLPELFWELPGNKISKIRYLYHDHVAERFTEAFADVIGTWCEKHDIMLTGHLMEEPTLYSQTSALGEAMRSYRSFHFPGIDILADRREYTTAKQTQSAAHQYGREGVLSELYGVTSWNFDFRGHKLQGDWQAALGVTVRCHHLTWVSMEGEAKRDYPASIGYQSPWFREYPVVEDYFSRVNTVLTRGQPQVRIGVIHPIESYWLYWGPKEQTAVMRDELENNFQNITQWLLFGLMDFDYIAESLLPDIGKVRGKSLQAGKMEYEVVLVPGCKTLRSTTVDLLEQFHDAGGSVVFVGNTPELVDAEPSTRVTELARQCTVVPFSQNALLQTVGPYRDIEVRKDDGIYTDNLFYNMRRDGKRRWLFLAHATLPENPDTPSIETIDITVRGRWKATVYDAMDGTTRDCPATLAEGSTGKTKIRHRFSAHDSLLLALEPATQPSPHPEESASEGGNNAPAGRKSAISQSLSMSQIEGVSSFTRPADPVPIDLSEPNVLLLDLAEYSFDDGPWESRDEILRIDNKLRERLEWPLRGGRMAQPWVVEEKSEQEHYVALRFSIESEIPVKGAQLALEHPERTSVELNGRTVLLRAPSTGWWVDESIRTVDLPEITQGHNELVVKTVIRKRIGLEWYYLLGEFGVKVAGSHAKITAPVRELSFGDWTTQGLPFYAGNVTYRFPFTVPESQSGRYVLQTEQYRNPLLTVEVDGKRVGPILYAPYALDLGSLRPGEHEIGVTAFGNRQNAFGPVHLCDASYSYQGPPAWRTTGNQWSYEYRLRPMGLLISPKLWRKTHYDE